jgi:hypothetical protein
VLKLSPGLRVSGRLENATSIEYIDRNGAVPRDELAENKGDEWQGGLKTPGPLETVFVDGLPEARFYTSLPSEDADLVLPTDFVVQRKRQSYFLASLFEDTVLLTIPTGHVMQDSRRELLGIGAWDTVGAYRIESSAFLDGIPDAVSMRRLFGHEQEAIINDIDK